MLGRVGIYRLDLHRQRHGGPMFVCMLWWRGGWKMNLNNDIDKVMTTHEADSKE
jgi:hypothetical protein